MELRNVRAFLAVAGERHFGRAAAGLNLTQPALSLRIQVLERELGIQLLRRDAREVRLTPAGEALLDHARTLVQEEDRALREMKDHVAGLAGRLRVSYLTSWDAGLPAGIMTEFRRRYPSVKLDMTTGYSQTNIDRLIAREVDFAFVDMAIGDHDGIAIRPLDRHELVVVMAATHYLTERKSVPVECLRGEPMISTSAGVNAAPVAATLKWLTEGTGEPPNIVREEPPDQMAAALAQSGNAIALMTEHRAVRAAADGLVYRRLTPTPVIEYGMAYLQEIRSAALTNLLETAESIAPPLPDLSADTELLGVRGAWRYQALDHLRAGLAARRVERGTPLREFKPRVLGSRRA
jgi:DNA-binding transcriptional LysR family regulator